MRIITPLRVTYLPLQVPEAHVQRLNFTGPRVVLYAWIWKMITITDCSSLFLTVSDVLVKYESKNTRISYVLREEFKFIKIAVYELLCFSNY